MKEGTPMSTTRESSEHSQPRTPTNRHRRNLWRETHAGLPALTERVETGRKDHDRSRKTMVEALGFDPDLGWIW